MYATDFEYAGKKLSDFNCITCYINKSTGVEEINIGCDITFNTVKNNHSSIQYVTSTSYDKVYSDTFEIMKNVCDNNEDKYFSYEEVRNLMKWLNRREYAAFKPLYNDGTDVYYYGSFNIQQIMLGNNVIGLSLTFTSNAPYGFGESIVHEFELGKGDTFSIYGDSDESEYTIYPNVTIFYRGLNPNEPGLYNANNVRLATWDELVNTYGLDLSVDINPLDYDKTQESLYYVLNNYDALSTGKKLVIDDSATISNMYQFFKCNLEYIFLPKTVTEINSNMFSDANVKEVGIQTSVTSITCLDTYLPSIIYYTGTEEQWNTISITHDLSSKNIIYNYNSDSDMGAISIVNQLTGTNIVINNCILSETITIDGEHKIITTDNEEHKETIFNDFNYEYLDIEVTEDNIENIYEVNASCTLKIEYSPIRKVGV